MTAADRYIQYALIVFSFLVPFFFSNYQILTGSFVNAMLFIFAGRINSKYALPVIFLPSVAVLSRGLIFGHFTKFLIFFMPFIWASNWILIFAFNKISIKNYAVRVIIAASLKTLFLFAVANLFFSLNLIPRMFLQSMGSLQFVTAVAGGIISYIFIVGAHNCVPHGVHSCEPLQKNHV